jgi:hypothetical protein
MEKSYHELLAEVYEENAANTLVYAHEHLGPNADEFNVDNHEENELEDKEEFNKFQGARGKPEHVIKPKAKNDNDGKASFNYDKHIRTYAINVDGKFRAYPNIVPIVITACATSTPTPIDIIPPSDSTHFLFKASRLYKNIFSIKVTSFEFFNCFYTFTEARGNNKFVLVDNIEFGKNNPLAVKTIKIPDGNYFIQPGSPQVIDGLQLGATGPINPTNSNDLLLVINSLIHNLPRQPTESSYYGTTVDTLFQDVYIEVDASDGFIIFYRKPKGTGVSNPFSINFPKTDDNVYKNGIGYNLGFSQLNYSSGISTSSKHYATYHSIESESFPDTVNDTYVYLKLNDWYIIRHQNPDQTEIAAFIKIPLTATKNTIQYMSSTSNTTLNEYFFPQPTNFQTIEVTLVDSFGKLIDMRGASFSMTLQIQEVLQSDIYEKMLELQ